MTYTDAELDAVPVTHNQRPAGIPMIAVQNRIEVGDRLRAPGVRGHAELPPEPFRQVLARVSP
jgi:hypothetical protein